jgi:adenylate cyclase
MTHPPAPHGVDHSQMTARTRGQLRTLAIILGAAAMGGTIYGAALSLTWGVGTLPDNMLRGLLSGVFISLICGGADVFVLSNQRMRAIRALPFLAFVALRALVYAVGIFFGLRAPEWLLGDDNQATIWSFSNPLFVQTFVVSLGISFGVALTIEVSRLLGPGVLPALLTGRYHRPRREERVFLFADIEGSTALAERIGDLEFHRFLSAVFSDWAEPVSAARGETHRYVGDEIIVTWPQARGVKKARCITCVLAMRDALDARRAWYLREFGIEPKFRAALHCGHVVTGEMGDQRKEIVFLGDTVNTTSRMQIACRENNVRLILSGALADRMPTNPRFSLRALGVWTPRGKSREVRLYTATRT